MTGERRVLVVDSESETEEVLKAVLGPRGLHVDRVRKLTSEPASERPHLLVIDDDGPRPAPPADAESSSTNEWSGVPRVIIGSARLAEDGSVDGRRYLQKPFQFGELIRAIDQLLTERAA